MSDRSNPSPLKVKQIWRKKSSWTSLPPHTHCPSPAARGSKLLGLTAEELQAVRVGIGNSTKARARRLRAQEHARLHPSSALTRVRRRNGSRVFRAFPLRAADLYENDARPPTRSTTKSHQRCGLCGNVKSHPVSYGFSLPIFLFMLTSLGTRYECGHSHCYVCIRLHLEFDWACPHCSKIITRAPYCHHGEEDGITCDFPDWHDTSRVAYSWDGLTWPRPRIVQVVSDDSS
ncbi:hypothetical protein B0H13DRAFT_1897574 [Mycena leptocephala]|nr:hypothetical protein B0H13DRAFT_1897574 [Mycena leptocephala]